MAAALTYTVEAFNTAKASENKIHDDAIAKKFGFGGGLVPGAIVYAYMTHLPVERWGRAWLEHGTAECRFSKPVYDGDKVTVTAAERDDGGLDLRLECRGVVCAVGTAALPNAVVPPALAEFRDAPQRANRPPADESSLAVGTWLGIDPLVVTPELIAEYVSDVRETLPLYAGEGLLHPVLVPHIGNFALNRNVTLGPWMHVGSKIQHFAAARRGDSLTVRARVVGNYEHKGHLFVDLDALIVANNSTPIVRTDHLSIYRPRQVLAA
ncbi:MAG TPA: MaoC family dehydratase [Stellaceae bacterium]|nr:MaoC family dehydratase [Stellaceae bacterium]